MRSIPALLVSSLLTLSACSSSYERTAGGALIGGATGAMAGAMCCGDPIGNTGKGAVVGIAIGAVIGLVIDVMSSD